MSNNTQEKNIQEEMLGKLRELLHLLAQEPANRDQVSEMLRHGAAVQGMSGYLSYEEQRGVGKMTKLLALGTFLLAIATFALAYITWIKP